MNNSWRQDSLYVIILCFTGCGGYLVSTTGSFTSPNYPNPYPHRRECVWMISLPTGNAIELTIVDFDLETHSSCQYDVLEVNSHKKSSLFLEEVSDI